MTSPVLILPTQEDSDTSKQAGGVNTGRFSGGSRARSRRGKILRSGICFEPPSHMYIPYVFVARVLNKTHILNILC